MDFVQLKPYLKSVTFSSLPAPTSLSGVLSLISGDADSADE